MSRRTLLKHEALATDENSYCRRTRSQTGRRCRVILAVSMTTAITVTPENMATRAATERSTLMAIEPATALGSNPRI